MRYVFGDYLLDTQRYELWCRGERLKLRPKVFEVLVYLIRHRQRVVAKDELLEQLWPKQFIGDGSLNACLMAVRRAVGDSGQAQRHIQTLHGRGYRFVAAVEEQDNASQDGPTESRAPATPGADLPQPAPPPGLAASAPASTAHVFSVPYAVPQAVPGSAPQPRLDQEHKQVTVLCCGLTEAASLAAQLGAEAMYHLMQSFFAQVQGTMARYGGSLMHYGGDGFMALFGAPVAYEDHARRALLAGVELQQQLEVPQGLPGPPPHRVPLALRLALHTGPVVTGSVAPDAQRLYTAVGDTTTLATLLLQVAPSASLLLSEATYRLLQDEVEAEVWVAGASYQASLSIPAYRVRGLRQRHAGVPRRGGQPPSPFVGRTQELAILQARLTQAAQGQGQLVGISGEAGLGKSRLLSAFLRQVQERPITTLTGQCLPYGGITPYGLVRLLLRQRWGIADTAGSAAIRARVQSAVQDAPLGSEEDIALVLQVLDVPVETAPLAHLSPEARQARLFTLLRQVILHSSPQPLLLLVEDVHWIDPTSEAWLAAAAAGLAARAVLVLVTYRPGYHPPWIGQSGVTQLALAPLPPYESLLVVQAMPHPTPLPDHLQQVIVAKAAGNPFFLEELTRSVVEHGTASLRLPETIHAVLAARIDRLPADAKYLLQLAAVCGTEVAWPLVRVLTGWPEETLWSSLQQLLTAELLSEVSPLSADVYSFKHALIQEVAYQSLLSSRRQTYHQQIAQALEQSFPEQAAAQPARVAQHYTAAGCLPQAIDSWQRAGEQAFQRGAHHEALEDLQRSLTLLDSLPETLARMRCELALLTTLGPVLSVAHGVTAPEVERVYTRAHVLCQHVPDTLQQAAVLRGLGYFYRTKGQHQRARTLAEELLALAQTRQEARLLLEASLGLGMVLLSLGEFATALAHLEQGLAHRDAALRQSLPAIPHPVLGCLFYSGFALWYLGYADQARTRIHTGLELAQRLAYPHHLVWGQHLGAIFYQCCRNVPAVQELADAVVSGASALQLQICRTEGVMLQGWTLVQSGHGEAGLAQIRQGLTESRARGTGASLPRYSALLAEAYGCLGQIEPGLAVLTEAQHLIKTSGEYAHAAEIARLQGEFLLAQAATPSTALRGQPDSGDAEACLYQALDIARSQQAKMLELRAAMSLSRLWQQQGKRLEAYQVLAAVYGWFTEGFDTADLQEAQTLLRNFSAPK